VRNDSGIVQDSRFPRNFADSCAETQPSSDDVFQAAALLVGVFGHKATGYAAEQRNRLDLCGDGPGAMVWELILSRIEVLLHHAPPRNLN